MAATTITTTTETAAGILAHHLALFPPPLHVRKKSRKFRHLFPQQRKATRAHPSPSCGPLDDIINEIAVDILPPKRYDTYEHPVGLDGQALWAITTLPISRAPSDQPLAVRKTRSRNTNSRSTASGSTCSGTMVSSGSEGSGKRKYTNPQSAFGSASATATATATNLSNRAQRAPEDLFPSFNEGNGATLPSRSAVGHQLSSLSEGDESSSIPSRPDGLRKRFVSLSNVFDKLRFRTTDQQSSAGFQADTSQNKSSAVRLGPAQGASVNTQAAEDKLATWMGRHGHRASMIQAVYSKAAEYIPSPHEFRQELPRIDDDAAAAARSDSTVAATVKITPEVKLLTKEDQTFWIAIEVEGVLHNKRTLSDQAVDVVFIIDNAYHVTDDCLKRACDIVGSSLYNLKANDRVALYTTHCTHEAVTGTVPDMWYPLGTCDDAAADIIRDMISDIQAHGTQTWKWPRPNPPMSEVLISIAKSLEARDSKPNKTHMMLISPGMRGLHEVSKPYPSVSVHQINPAVLPFNRGHEPEEFMCMENCCDNISGTNLAHYQSAPDRVRQLIRYARLEKPIGMICNLHVDVKRMPGCEVLGYEGSTDISRLRLGQVHTFFAEIRVLRSHTIEMDLERNDPVRDSTLTANNLMQDLRNAMVLGASKVHLCSVQLMHQNSLFPSTHWNFTESPLLVLKELGRLSMPTDRALEVYKRRFFATMSRRPLGSDIGRTFEVLNAAVKPELKEIAQRVLEQMATELESHRAIVDYENSRRAHLPSSTGPIPLPYIHQHLVDKWETRKKKRMGHYVAKA